MWLYATFSGRLGWPFSDADLECDPDNRDCADEQLWAIREGLA